MPCKNYESDWSHSESLQEKLDTLAKMLCYACNLLEEKGIPLERDDIAQWWGKHQESDRLEALKFKLLEEEQARRTKALLKLTKAERLLLKLPL